MSVTLAEIARVTETHPSTVSLVLNGRRHDRVSVVTRRRIEAVAAELGYRANRHAQGLARGSTKMIALLLNSLTNPFFGKYVSVIERIIEGRGYQIVPYETKSSDARELELLSLHRQGLCDLVLSLCHYTTDRDDAMTGQPVVVRMDGWDPAATARCPVPHTVVDYRPALQRLLSGLHAAGRKYVGLVMHGVNAPFSDAEAPSPYARSLRLLLKQSGLRAGPQAQVVAHETDSLQVWHDRTLKLLRDQPEVDCLLVHTTEFIAPAIEAARKAGRQIGADLALAAFDDPPFAAWIEGGITVLREPIAPVANALVSQALAVLQGQVPPASTTIEAELVERHSTRPELRAGVGRSSDMS
jgi:DNA-binding LacI/PurR family transcriptional regulator